jgi:hypothetical protein
MPKPNLKRVSRFAAIARKTGGMFVFASRDATLPDRKSVSAEIAGYKYANHHCNSCTATFAFPKAEGSQPFCVLCGEGDVDVQEDVKPNIAPDEELSYLTCAGCGTANVFHKAMATVGAVHCSACGTDMLPTADTMQSAEPDEDEEDETPEHEALETPEEESLEEAEDDGEDGDTGDSDLDNDGPEVDDMELLDLEDDLDDTPEHEALETPEEEGIEEEAVTTNEDVAPNGNVDGKPLADEPRAKKTPGAPDSPQTDGKPKNTGLTPPTQNPGALEPKVTKVAADADEMPENDYSGESLDMDLVDVDEDADTPIEAISFFYGDAKVMLSSKDQIIATLAEADAGTYKDMLQTEQFRMSVAHTIETEGLKKAIATYKFKPSKISIPLSKIVAKKVEAALQKQKVQVQAGADTYAEQFQHSLDIAAAGYAGNFWRNKHDPLKTALIAELAGIGIRKPEKIIDKVFATYSVAQFREVLEVARSLSKKPVEALNALAETIDLVKYTPTRSKQTAEDDGASETDLADDMDQDDEDFVDTSDEFATATPVESVTASLGRSPFKTPELQKILGNTTSFFN